MRAVCSLLVSEDQTRWIVNNDDDDGGDVMMMMMMTFLGALPRCH